MKNLEYFKEYQTTIHPDEVEDDFKALMTLVDGRRTLGYFVEKDFEDYKNFAYYYDLLIEKGFKRKDIEGKMRPFILYTKEREADAQELKEIAERYSGYLSYEATAEETRRIGQILRFHPWEVEKYIKERY